MRRKVRYELLLTEDPGLRGRCVEEIRSRFGGPVEWLGENFFQVTLKTPPGKAWETAQQLVSIPGVLDADPDVPEDRDLELARQVGEAEKAFMESPAARIKEGYYPAWFQDKTHFPAALKYAVAECEAGRGHFDGTPTGIRVGQLDTGYTDHPEVAYIKKDQGRNYVPPKWFRRLFQRKWKFDARDPVVKIPVIYWSSHGTGSAGVFIGSESRGCEFLAGGEERVDGVFPFVDMIPFRVCSSVISFRNNLARGALEALERGCKVITVSHATLICSRLLESVVARSYERGVIWVAAAGSHIARLKKIWIYPARFPETIAVAASTIEDEPWEWTHAGVKVDICAPGYQIYKPYAMRRYWLLGRLKYSYTYSEGSTFSTPITAAAAALWLAHHGEEKLNHHYKEPWQRVEAFRHLLKTTAIPHKDRKNDKYYGAGLLNAEALIKAPLPRADILKRARPPLKPGREESEGQKRVAIVDKELTYHTAHAKVATADRCGDELIRHVESNCSCLAMERVGAIAAGGAGPLSPGDDYVKENPGSRALKRYIKNVSAC